MIGIQKNIVVVRIAYCNHWHCRINEDFPKVLFTPIYDRTSTYFICCCRVHTNAFSLSSKTHRTIRVHTNVFMRSRLSTKRYRIARCDVSWTLCACYKRTRLRYFRSSFSLDTSSTVYTNTICMHFRFDPLSFKSVFKSMRFRWKLSAY